MKLEELKKDVYKKLVKKIQRNVKIYKGSCLPPKDSAHFQEIEHDVDWLLEILDLAEERKLSPTNKLCICEDPSSVFPDCPTHGLAYVEEKK